MTLEEVAAGVEEVREAIEDKYDDEAAHGHEDKLYLVVLAAIANGEADNPQELARIAITTQTLGHERWYA